ncbi:predicted protein [Plenodomus lingam JN3]|uniref:Predicted protein n=1 Tax=Leptosphaeria maculans (strain JN3 / isolate v23.1.3 / race Av1-4-5-6-7-8) TaxID=985895 RepID=E5A8J9_LEPMJ|nr:predicted protein [Plenodomus lingam JN3]CBX99944.1 predicted protein [Plenodomus lingam JN3]
MKLTFLCCLLSIATTGYGGVAMQAGDFPEGKWKARCTCEGSALRNEVAAA